MTTQSAYQYLVQQLLAVYEQREAGNIADIVIEKITGKKRLDRILEKDNILSEEKQKNLKKVSESLLQNMPVQYAIGEAWFMNMNLQVNNSVLIPRPETEELVDWVVKDVLLRENKEVSVLDLGTGSGCIAIAIKKQIPATIVSAIDIAENALQVAKINSVNNEVIIDFLCADILDENSWKQMGHYDIIVSNPPYITAVEQAEMQKNVMDYEPHLALFVIGHDPLLFYRAIANFAVTHLKANGNIYVEINENFGFEVIQAFKNQGFDRVELKKDMQGKDRMLKAWRSF